MGEKTKEDIIWEKVYRMRKLTDKVRYYMLRDMKDYGHILPNTLDYVSRALKVNFTEVGYPEDKSELDSFYKIWYKDKNDNLGESWSRPEVYDFASKYHQHKISNQ